MKKSTPKPTKALICFCLFWALTALSCASASLEIHQIPTTTVIYTTGQEINEAWKDAGGLGEVKGFYNPSTKTIWCEKFDYNTCWHEMRHVLEGNFHD